MADGVVLAQPIGRVRPFWQGFLLTIVTAGLYAVYWNYRAHHEVHEQFELASENRDEGVVWLLLGLLVTPLLFVYMWLFVGNVEYVRARLGIKQGVTQGLFLGILLAAFVAFVGYVFAAVAFVGLPEINDETAPEIVARSESLALAALAAIILTTLLVGLAYYLLQRDINQLWAAFGTRLRDLRARDAAQQATVAASTSLPEDLPTYLGDLGPHPVPARAAHREDGPSDGRPNRAPEDEGA